MFQRKARRESKDLELNINSLMDIMTILLLFLLMSFQSQPQKVNPPHDISLPPSTSEQPVKLAVKVSISQTEVRVEDTVVAKLAHGKFRTRDVDHDNDVAPLLKALQRQKARLQSGTTVTKVGDEDQSEIVYFEAAKGTDFAIIDQAMKTAAAAGFTKFRLAVNRKI